MKSVVVSLYCITVLCVTLVAQTNAFDCPANYTFTSCPRSTDEPEQRNCCDPQGVQQCCFLREVLETWQLALVITGLVIAIIVGSCLLCLFCGWASTLDECANICISFVCCRTIEGEDDEEPLRESNDEITDGIPMTDLAALRRFRQENYPQEQKITGRSSNGINENVLNGSV